MNTLTRAAMLTLHVDHGRAHRKNENPLQDASATAAPQSAPKRGRGTKLRKVALSGALGIVGLVAACTDMPVQPESTVIPSLQVASVRSQVSMDLLARGLAIALADDDFRMQILEDMRDSPFPNHSLHLPSYVSRGRGQSIMAAIGGQLRGETGAFARGLAAGGNIAFYVNPPEFRSTWEGDADLAVIPLFEGALSADGFVVGYRPGGVEVSVGFYAPATFPVFLVGLSEMEFGSDPESKRASAPRHGRPTISTPAEEFGPPLLTVSTLVQCNEETGEGCECQIDPDLPECGGAGEGPPAPPRPPPGYYVAGTDDCVNYVALGADHDGMLDSCEYYLSAAMAPSLLIDASDKAPTFEPYYAARLDGQSSATGRQLVKIFYAVAYHEDPGMLGHNGDSEYVAVWASDEGNGYWSREWVLTAAHVGSPAASSKLWAGRPENVRPYPVNILLYPEFVSSRPLGPRVWVSRDKHANYGSKFACNNGGGFLGTILFDDTCTGSVVVRDFVAYSDGNLGRKAYHDPPMRNCTNSRIGAPGQECFWNAAQFKGWQGGSGGTTPYLDHLRTMGFR